MGKNQWIAISIALASFLLMYFGCDTKPANHKIIEKQRSENAESTSIASLLMEAKKDLTSSEGSSILAKEMDLTNASDDASKASASKALSSLWYGLGKPAIAGHYAEEAASLEKTEEAWSIAGTTFSLCLQKEPDTKIRQYCTDHAVRALESAMSLNTSNLQHQINLALVYAENPPSDNPMKGVLMLVNLNKQEPENVAVLNQLGRLAIKTGQFDKALERLNQAVGLEPANETTNCLLAKAYEGTNNPTQASKYAAKCEELKNIRAAQEKTGPENQ